MGMEFETTGSVEFEPGAYEGHLIRMEKKHKIFSVTDDEGNETKEDRSFYIWYFAVDEEGYEDVTLTAISSTSWGPKSKARRWAGYILGRKLGDNETVREDDMKNKPVMLNIDLEENDRGTFAKVTDLTPVRKKGSKQQESEEDQAAEMGKHLDDQEKKAS
jgi:hypothetical protein